jgi:hypothetical protein
MIPRRLLVDEILGPVRGQLVHIVAQAQPSLHIRAIVFPVGDIYEADIFGNGFMVPTFHRSTALPFKPI